MEKVAYACWTLETQKTRLEWLLREYKGDDKKWIDLYKQHISELDQALKILRV